jgi:hypothetical protein
MGNTLSLEYVAADTLSRLNEIEIFLNRKSWGQIISLMFGIMICSELKRLRFSMALWMTLIVAPSRRWWAICTG